MPRHRIGFAVLLVGGLLTASCSSKPTAPSATGEGQAAPAITAHPQSQTVSPGASASLEVTASGASVITFQWFAGLSGDTSAPVPGATESVYRTPPMSAPAHYWVRVSGASRSANSDTAVINISAEAPRITRQPKDEIITTGATARLGIEASGTALRYQWYRGNAGSTANPLAGETGDKLTTPVLSETTSFWVRVANEVGVVDSTTATVTVTAASSPAPGPAPAPPTNPTPPAPPPAGPDAGVLAFEDEVLSRVNGLRTTGASCGGTAMPPVAPLTMNDALRTAARAHSQDMATRGYFSHTSPEGVTFVDRIQAAGYSGSPYGENIGVGYSSPAAVVAAWMSSAGHCSAIMNASYRAGGMGYSYRAGSPYGHYWTLDFGGR